MKTYTAIVFLMLLAHACTANADPVHDAAIKGAIAGANMVQYCLHIDSPDGPYTKDQVEACVRGVMDATHDWVLEHPSK
jgi:hypothetical protein